MKRRFFGKAGTKSHTRKHIHRSTYQIIFHYTHRQMQEFFYGKEIVRYFYKHFTKGKAFNTPAPVVDETSFRSNLFTRLIDKQRYYINLMALTLFVFISVDFIDAAVIKKGNKLREKQINKELLLDGKTITGYVVDGNGQPWNNQIARIMLADTTVAIDTIVGGHFTFNDVVTAVGDEENTTPDKFTLKQNYPNPFNPNTTIQYTLTNTSSVLLEVFDILGRKVTTLKNTTEPAGTYNVIWNGRNSDGRIIASGVYIYRATIHNRVTGKEISISKKAVYEKHAPNNPVWGRSAANANDGIKTVNGINKVNEDYILKISGDDVLTTEIAVNLTAPSPIDLGTIVANAKPIIKSTANGVYDIDTKFDANNNRVTPTKIESLKVYLGSDPSVYTFTDSNGQFSLKVDKLGTDSLFITGKTPSDTAYYNWHLPEINIVLGENEVTAFNDTTGIPMISRMYDTGLTTLNENNVGVDFLDYFFYVTDIKSKWPQYPEWSKTMPRIRDEDLPIKVFMNRAIAPNNWYADSSMAGLRATETGRYQFQEVSTADSALLIMRYDNNNVGEGTG